MGLSLPPPCLDRVAALIACGQRKILGLVAQPGAGKSTLAQALGAAFPQDTQIVSMDGFHLANGQLARLGLAQRKGAPDTFDSFGFLNLLHRIKNQVSGETVYAPDFRRDLEEAVAGAIAVQAQTPLVIIEGNYLLLADPPWAQIRGVVDEMWYLDVDEATRQERLLRRHMRFGRTRAQALAWISQTDDPNALRIAQTRHLADWCVAWDEQAV